MAARFAQVRITGFKSFADSTTIEIRPGLTGIVGPNGCGKSNVVDALRWAMGEASAKSLRGGEMEDVIFAGTMARPARNLAEVEITLTETSSQAPPPFQAEAELQISRKIERGSGSAYRINGREVRARDVATLFADLASGARNSALISQGRISALVNARPEDRRALLEEAAGITGLHARRHEAELKLRATEQNLLRVDDLRGQQEVRLTELRKQARQANRYRNISGLIRGAESEYLATEQEIAVRRRTATRMNFSETDEAVHAAEQLKNEALAAESEHHAVLPALRDREGAARTRLERARIQAEQVEAEISRIETVRREAAARLVTLQRDNLDAERVVADADASRMRLEAERATLSAERAEQPAILAEATKAAAAAAAELARCEEVLQRATEVAARISALRETIDNRLSQARDRARQARRRADDASSAHYAARKALIPPEQVASAETARVVAAERLAEAETTLIKAQELVVPAEGARIEASASSSKTRCIAAESEEALSRLRAEKDALTAVLGEKLGRESVPILDQITVPAGLETALGAALRDELSAGQDADCARYWRVLPPIDTPTALPRISERIEAPASLRRIMDHILLLPDGEDGAAHQASLAPGQILVSAEGALWRWDGFIASAGAPTEAGVRLAQRNRLLLLERGFVKAAKAAEQARAAQAAAEIAERNARKAEDEARIQRREAESAVDRARSEVRSRSETSSRLASEAEQLAAREATAADTYRRLETEANEAEAALSSAEAEMHELGDSTSIWSELDRARATLAESRQRNNQASQAVQHLNAEVVQRDRRLEAIDRELADWTARTGAATDRRAELATRLYEAEERLATTTSDDNSADDRRATIKAQCEAANAEHSEAHRMLAAAERAAREFAGTARDAEQKLAHAREARIIAESAVREADHAWGSIMERILERFGVDAVLPSVADSTPEAAERARRRLERLTRERDEMGPVNLRAEVDVGEIETRLAGIEREREEITSAIAKLRGSIGHLNREGRERLSAVFTEIDRHFQALFTRMFGGGRAHLALTGSDDPLEAGLEIFAEPPGKKLATLSLLSGGEQALTALSLIFAVFRCNPAPLSVLDEVDAPLDDANVERFCRLIEDIARDTETRFLVVTHHHHTMARMDRLYGVTMQERGVSRILSVDLGTAATMVEPAGAIAAE